MTGPHAIASRTSFYSEALRYLPPLHCTSTKQQVSVDEVVRAHVLMPVDACGLAGQIDRLLVRAGASIYSGRALTYETLAQWAELGMGGALLPDGKVPRPGFPVVVRASGEPVMVEHEVVWSRSQRSLPHVDAAIEHFTSGPARRRDMSGLA